MEALVQQMQMMAQVPVIQLQIQWVVMEALALIQLPVIGHTPYWILR